MWVKKKCKEKSKFITYPEEILAISLREQSRIIKFAIYYFYVHVTIIFKKMLVTMIYHCMLDK